MDIKNLKAVPPFATKDGSEIRELLAHRNSAIRQQSLAEARLPVGGSTQEHYHVRTEEIYYITHGAGRIRIDGETREIARMHAALAREMLARGGTRACFLSGGETTVTIRGDGLGGRNQEFTLAAALDIAGLDRVVVFSAGTDGTDGPTDAAGAIADGHTLARNPDARLYLDRNDSYHYFQSLGDLVVTGPTNTNVMDVHLILVASGK